MAERRMFAKTILDSDLFLDMPLSTQALYFHLAMRADDDGFVNNPRKISRMIGANDDSLKLLIAKQYLIPFESGVVVIKHWRLHNYIRSDTYKGTIYHQEFEQLERDKQGTYYLCDATEPSRIRDETVTDTSRNCNETLTQDSIGKVSIVKDRSGNTLCAITQKTTDQKQTHFVPPTVEEVIAYCKERGKPIDAEAFVDFYASKGWKVGSQPMKDWKAAVRNWRRSDEQKGTVYKPKSGGNNSDLDFIFGSGGGT